MSIVRTYKKNIGGVWRLVLVYKCPKCGAENNVIKNWSGPTPAGGVPCSECGATILFKE